MIHMLSCFNLAPGTDPLSFCRDFKEFTLFMQENGLVVSASPIGRRCRDTILDTDKERLHQYFCTMSFCDWPQANKAIAYIKRHDEPGHSIHFKVYGFVRDPIFICWEDMEAG